jgi:type VI secretion system protein ImpC
MPPTFSFGKIQFDLSPARDKAGVRRGPEEPFRLAVLGDFTGRGSRAVIEALGSRRPVRVDCDNLESVWRSLGAVVRLPTAGPFGADVELRFESLDDFHPDQLLLRVAALEALARTRERLLSPGTATAAVAEAQQLLALPPQPLTSAAPGGSPAESIQETMARLLGGCPPAAAPADKPPTGGFDINALIKTIVAPSVVPGATPAQSAALGAVEVELAARLRAILHHPHFQAVEALWRGLDLLVRAHAGEEGIQLSLLDVSKEELMAELRAQENLEKSSLGRALGEPGWAVLVGAFTFDDSVADLEALGRLAKLSCLHGTAFMAAASPHLIGCDSLIQHPDPTDWTRGLDADGSAAWTALRALAEAPHLGLVLPRVLLRQPYGKGSDPIDAFPFEEMAGGAAHECFLWGNGAFVAAHVLVEQFCAEGWQMTFGGPGELDGLPVFKFAEGSETRVKPCAEAWLSERAGERIVERGVMPLLSVKGRGSVRLPGLPSVAQPVAALRIRCG